MDRELRNLSRRVDRARRFPRNTCAASRHLHMIANCLARGRTYGDIEYDPEWCAASMLAVLESLWKLRTEVAKAEGRTA